jgi:hypothetical protein
MKAENYKITISWNVEDVLSLDDTLTTDQCIEVLDMAEKNHDANYGISWDTLSSYIEDVKEESITKRYVEFKRK